MGIEEQEGLAAYAREFTEYVDVHDPFTIADQELHRSGNLRNVSNYS